MDKNEVMAKLKAFISSELGVEEELLEYDAQLFGEDCEVGLDSIDSLMIISFADEEYGVSLAGIDRSNFLNISTIAEYIVNNAQ